MLDHTWKHVSRPGQHITKNNIQILEKSKEEQQSWCHG